MKMTIVPPYIYIYETEGAFGIHQSLSHESYNGRNPDRVVPLYIVPPDLAERVAELEEKLAECMEGLSDAGTELQTAWGRNAGLLDKLRVARGALELATWREKHEFTGCPELYGDILAKLEGGDK